ncbi:MAG: MerR family transcriptional regulator [Paracoccaceae bacterium]
MEKSAEAFRTISEVSDILDTPAHVLRFWESRFSQVKPVKRAGGRRYYRPADLALLAGIKKLLHDDGLTIRGVQKLLREQGVRHVAEIAPVDVTAPAAPKRARKAAAKPAKSKPAAPGKKADDTDLRPKGWPPSPDPDVTGAPDQLLPDPDQPIPAAAEAPMEVDVPTLPFGRPDNVLPLGTPITPTAAEKPEAAASGSPAGPPAAALLRAMDALRAREKQAELTSVYRRLTDLRERVVRSSGTKGR